MSGVRTTENCRFCWMCRHMCPVGHVTSLETYTPHAWALTIESVERGQLRWDADTAGVMYACADCGLCQSHCVTDQPLPDAIAAARARIVDAGVAPVRVYELQRMLERYANVYAPVAPQPPRQVRSDVVLWVGDVAHHLQPGMARAAARLLEAAGIDVVPIGAGRSSGWRAASLGLTETARTLARAAVAEVEASGAREVVVLSAADAWAFGQVYGSRLNVEWPTRVIVREATAVLAERLREGRLRLARRESSGTYAFHDPCHAPRLKRDPQQARTLLDAVAGEAHRRELFWRADRAHPCGAIGGLEFIRPDLSRALAAARWDDARAAGAERLVVDDPTCYHHLADSQPAGATVESLFDVLGEALVT